MVKSKNKVMTDQATRVSFHKAFTTKVSQSGSVEVYHNGTLVGDVYNLDSRPIVVE